MKFIKLNAEEMTLKEIESLSRTLEISFIIENGELYASEEDTQFLFKLKDILSKE